MAGVLFEDIFNVKDIDPEGKKFDRGEWWCVPVKFEVRLYSRNFAQKGNSGLGV